MLLRSLRINLPHGISLPSKGTNLGLWFQKYLDQTVENPSQKLIDSITELPNQVNEVYKHFYNRWLIELKGIQAATEIAKTQGRMIVNLGADSVSEVGIALHHTYGMPYIPGTALKWLAAHYANSNLGNVWKKNANPNLGDDLIKKINFHQAIFGTGKEAGYVTFHDALFVPDCNDKFPQKDLPNNRNKPLQKDVVTGHHQNYNKGDDLPPADWDSPTIIPFISVHGKFLIAVSGDEKAKPVAMEILRLALLHEGIGAKTSSGYGRMVFESHPDDSIHRKPTIATMEAVVPEETYEVKRKRLLKETPPEGWKRGDVRRSKPNGASGFITPSEGGKDVYVKNISFEDSGALVEVGQVLEYTEEIGPQGPRAISVRVLLKRN